MKAVFQKRTQGLVPVCDESEKLWQAMSLGQKCKVSYSDNRNYENLQRFFELRNQTFEIQDDFDDKELWRKQLLIMGGHFEMVIVPRPEWWERMKSYLNKFLEGPQKESLINRLDEALGVQMQAKSIAFDQMSEAEFRELFARCVTAFINRYSPGMDENQFRQICEFD